MEEFNMAKAEKGARPGFFSRLVVRLNNWFRERSHKGLVPEQVLLLLPRCIQRSECVQNISKDIRNCKGCGRCPIKDIVEIVDEYGVLAFVAPGGRAALARVLEEQVRAVVAVACELELRQGILASPKPVIGVVNKRPQGPCHNTNVDLAEIRRAIKILVRPASCRSTG
jgi:uncharacterized protein